jgi:hypothetical protein
MVRAWVSILRTRRAACRAQRRSVTKGQRAMATAMRYPDAEKGGKRVKGSSPVTGPEFSKQRLSEARAVLRHSRSQAESVVKGLTTLDTALATMRQEQQY